MRNFEKTGSGMAMVDHRDKIWRVWLPIIALLLLLSGCSLFRGGGPKERTIELTLQPAAELNWDGTASKTLQVAVFVLRNTDRLLTGQVATFFDPNSDKDYYDRFAAEDVVGQWTFTIRPGQTETQVVRYTIGKDDPKRVYLGVIGDFFAPADNGRERSVYTLQNASKQKITVVFGKDQIEKVERTP